MRAFDYLISLMVFEVILSLLFGLCVIPIYVLLELIGRNAHASVLAFVEALKVPFYVVVLAGILSVSWVAHDAARRFAVGSDTFWKALTAALVQARFDASFVPVIGKWIGIRRPDTPSIDRPIE